MTGAVLGPADREMSETRSLPRAVRKSTLFCSSRSIGFFGVGEAGVGGGEGGPCSTQPVSGKEGCENSVSRSRISERCAKHRPQTGLPVHAAHFGGSDFSLK